MQNSIHARVKTLYPIRNPRYLLGAISAILFDYFRYTSNMYLSIRNTVVLLLGIVFVVMGIACGESISEADIDATAEAKALIIVEASAQAKPNSEPVPATPESIATPDLEKMVAEAVAKALEDIAISALKTPVPEPTPIPTFTPTPTPTPMPTPTPVTPTSTPTPTHTSTPTPLPTSTPMPTPTPVVIIQEVIVEKTIEVLITPTPIPPTSTPVPTSTPSPTEASIMAYANPAVVQIVNSEGEGSGFIIRQDGLIVTNAHVVGDDTNVLIILMDETQYSGHVLDRDSDIDLALIKIDESELSFLEFENDDEVILGQKLIVIGYPLGLTGSATITTGIVSSFRFNLPPWNPAIQTDAAINPGSSGGPMLDFNGKVIGVASAMFANSEGMNLGITSTQAQEYITLWVDAYDKGEYGDPFAVATSTPTPVPDTTGPEISNLSPIDLFATKDPQNITIQADVYDAESGLGSTAYEVQKNTGIVINGSETRVPGVIGLGSGFWRITYAFSAESEGWYTWKVIAKDTSGNVTSTNLYWLLVDTSGPEILNISPSNGSVVSNQAISFQADIYDQGIGLGSTAEEVQLNSLITINESSWYPSVEYIGDNSWRISVEFVVEEGTYNWDVFVQDLLGNNTSLIETSGGTYGVTAVFATPTATP